MTRNAKSILTVSVFALMLIGTFFIISAKMADKVGSTDALWGALFKQLIIVVVSVVAYFTCKYLPIEKISFTLYWIAYIGILILLFVPVIIGEEVNGSFNWIDFGFFTVQPSEFSKVFAIIFGSKYISLGAKKRNSQFYWFYLVMMIVYFVVIVFLQNDFGSGFILAGIVFSILFISTSKEWGTAKFHNGLSWVLLGVIALCVLVMLPETNEILMQIDTKYRLARVTMAYNPFRDIYDKGYNLIHSLSAIGSGDWLGVGLGKSVHKYMAFTNASTDFILAVVIEETGITGFLIITLFYLLIMCTLCIEAYKSDNLKKRIVYFGVFIFIFMHYVLNVGGVTALLPLTGVPLLLISSGGSSTMVTLALIGFCVNDFKKGEK